MDVIRLSVLDLTLAAGLLIVLAGVSLTARLGVAKQLVISGARMVVQLALIGFVLEALFADAGLIWVALMAAAMVAVAGYEVFARQQRGLRGWSGYLIGAVALFVSSLAVAVMALTVFIQAEPWYRPQYAIPLLGMLLGNTMNGIALNLDRLTEGAWQRRHAIEAQLMLGFDWAQAIAPLRRESMRAGLIPIINAMAAAGVVSLPGMMTGQILAGTPPAQAVKYQILIFLLITVGTGLGMLLANRIAAGRLFDSRSRLRLERLRQPPR
jgi:putative ABC transport system permease protein